VTTTGAFEDLVEVVIETQEMANYRVGLKIINDV
jgi:hypothetical protein